MKTIFRSLNFGLILAAIFALGAVAGLAQDPCQDADGLTKASEKVRQDFTDYGKMSLEDRQKAIDNAKAFVDKYGKCDASADLTKYITDNLPPMETALKAAFAKREEGYKLARYGKAFTDKNYDDLYPAGKDLLNLNAEKYRPVELALGSVGYDLSLASPVNLKYNDQTLQYAKMALADLQADKKFTTWDAGGGYKFTGKDDAIGWMTASVGYLTFLKDKKGGLPYLYQAAQATGSTVAKGIPYGAIGDYYIDELAKITVEIEGMHKAQSPTDAPEVIKQKSDAIDAKVALAFGYAERAIDAYARAREAVVSPAAKAAYTKPLNKVYEFRFEKLDGLDAWVKAAIAKPFPNPTSEVTPVKVDVAPGGDATTAPGTKPVTPTTTPAKAGTPATKAPTGPIKPGTAKPGTVSKKIAAVKKRP